MSFFDLFRNFFGVGHHNEPRTNGFGAHDSHRENFRNPIWQNDEDDDDDDDDINNFWYPNSGWHVNISSDPREITSYFESQIDDILKHFFKFNNISFGDSDSYQGMFGGPSFPQLSPSPPSDNLRKEMLKPEPDTFAIDTDVPFENKVDTDLDGRVSTEEFSKLWNKGNIELKKPNHFLIGRSGRKEIVRRPDGSVEQKQIIKDTEGNEETIISRTIGEKTHVVTIRKDQSGVETRSEDLINMDENELKDFTQKWKSVKDNVKVHVKDSHGSILNHFPWEKFFGPNPKL